MEKLGPVKTFFENHKHERYLFDDVEVLIQVAKKELTQNNVLLLMEVLYNAKISFKEDCFSDKKCSVLTPYSKQIRLYSEKEYKNIELNDLKNLLLKNSVDVAFSVTGECVLIIDLGQKGEEIFNKDEHEEKLKTLFGAYSEKLFEKTKSGDIKDLIHFVAYHTIKKIGIKPKEEMIIWWEEYNKHTENRENVDDLILDNSKTVKSELLGYYCNKEVYLCDELIREHARSLAEEFMGYCFGEEKPDLEKATENIYNLLYKNVFTHEMGHLVFDWVGTKDRKKQEKQANYFSSYINDGEIDDFIKEFTRRQPKEYRNPYLKGDKRAEDLYK